MSVYTRILSFMCFAGRLVNTRAIMAIDVYTRHRFSESLGSRLGGPGQKALQEFISIVTRPLISLSGMPSVRPGTGL